MFTAVAAILCLSAFSGCVSTSGSASQAHEKGVATITGTDYTVSKRPVDNACIGCAWSKQFGPVDDPYASDIQIRKEKSFSGVQNDYAYKLGFGLGGRPLVGPQAEAGLEGNSVEKAKLEGVEIISPVNIADVLFEPGVPYVVEALRLDNFTISEDKGNKASLNLTAAVPGGSGTVLAESGAQARRGTSGEGLVVAYKLAVIDMPTYARNDSGSVPLDLGRDLDLPRSGLNVRARLEVIEPGSGKSLPRKLMWACPAAEAAARDMVAAWIVDLRPLDGKRKGLSIAFPALPAIEDCRSYSGVTFSRIDPLTDKISREKVNVNILDATLSDELKPEAWSARVSVTDESFNIKYVKPVDKAGK